MKYIKTFENRTSGQKYWKILIDDYFFIRLEKIGMSEDVQNDIYEHYCELTKIIGDHRYVWIGRDDYGGETFDWHWDFSSKNNSENLFYANSEIDNYIYQGEVEVTQQDIDNWKFKNDTKKYNL